MSDYDDADWDEEDYDSESDPDEADDEEPTIACPYCRREIHEEALQCPYCEQYLSEEDSPPAAKPWWIVVGVLVCLYIVYRWTFG